MFPIDLVHCLLIFLHLDIPITELGTYLEKKVMTFLKKRDSDGGNVTIRVLSSKDKGVEVKPSMKARQVVITEEQPSLFKDLSHFVLQNLNCFLKYEYERKYLIIF